MTSNNTTDNHSTDIDIPVDTGNERDTADKQRAVEQAAYLRSAGNGGKKKKRRRKIDKEKVAANKRKAKARKQRLKKQLKEEKVKIKARKRRDRKSVV